MIASCFETCLSIDSYVKDLSVIPSNLPKRRGSLKWKKWEVTGGVNSHSLRQFMATAFQMGEDFSTAL